MRALLLPVLTFCAVWASGWDLRADGEANKYLNKDKPWRQLTFLTDKQKEGGRDKGGPGGQYVTGIAYSASDPDRVILSIDCGGTWLSEDGGKTWARRDGDRVTSHVWGCAIDPVNKDVFYAWSPALCTMFGWKLAEKDKHKGIISELGRRNDMAQNCGFRMLGACRKDNAD